VFGITPEDLNVTRKEPAMKRPVGTGAQVLLAVILATGFGFAWCMATGWVAQFLAQFVSLPSSFVTFLSDGTPVVTSNMPDHPEIMTRTDLDGQLVNVGDRPDWLSVAILRAKSDPQFEHPQPGDPWETRIRAFIDRGQPARIWHLVANAGTAGGAYLVGYDPITKLRAGFIGAEGFRDESLPAEELFPFDGLTWGVAGPHVLCAQTFGSPLMMAPGVAFAYPPPPEENCSVFYLHGSDGKLYKIDLTARTVQSLLDQPGLVSAGMLLQEDGPEKRSWKLATRFDQQIQVRDLDGRVEKDFRLPAELENQSCTCGVTSKGQLLAYVQQPIESLDREQHTQIYLVDAAGQMLLNKQLDLPWGGWWHPPEQVFWGIAVPAPICLYPGTLGFRALELRGNGRVATLGAGLARAIEEYWPALAVGQVTALFLAWLCWRRQGLYAVSGRERLLWTTFVILGGLPGWIGYYYCRTWPVLESCPHCGNSVLRDRQECTNCTAVFPAPLLLGTEVFA
jgi:hypothetical protein